MHGALKTSILFWTDESNILLTCRVLFVKCFHHSKIKLFISSSHRVISSNAPFRQTSIWTIANWFCPCCAPPSFPMSLKSSNRSPSTRPQAPVSSSKLLLCRVRVSQARSSYSRTVVKFFISISDPATSASLNDGNPRAFVWFSSLQCRRFGRESVSYSKNKLAGKIGLRGTGTRV